MGIFGPSRKKQAQQWRSEVEAISSTACAFIHTGLFDYKDVLKHLRQEHPSSDENQRRIGLAVGLSSMVSALLRSHLPSLDYIEHSIRENGLNDSGYDYGAEKFIGHFWKVLWLARSASFETSLSFSSGAPRTDDEEAEQVADQVISLWIKTLERPFDEERLKYSLRFREDGLARETPFRLKTLMQAIRVKYAHNRDDKDLAAWLRASIGHASILYRTDPTTRQKHFASWDYFVSHWWGDPEDSSQE